MSENKKDNCEPHCDSKCEDKNGDDLIRAAQTAESIALIPVLTLIRDIVGVDVSADYGVKLDAMPGCVELKKNDGSVLRCKLAIVERSYDFLTTLSMHDGFKGVKTMDDIQSVDDFDVKKLIIDVISHVCNCALFAFNNVRNKYVELADLHLQMSNNTTLFISTEDEMNLGVIFY